jgi:hypothetical protein
MTTSHVTTTMQSYSARMEQLDNRAFRYALYNRARMGETMTVGASYTYLTNAGNIAERKAAEEDIYAVNAMLLRHGVTV